MSTLEERVTRLEQRTDQFDRIDQRLGAVEHELAGLQHELAGLRQDLRLAFERIFTSLDDLNRKPGFRWPWEPSR
jgi:hypothetical protein